MRGLPTVGCSVSVAQQGTGQNGATRGTSGKGEGEILMRERGKEGKRKRGKEKQGANTGEGEGEARSCFAADFFNHDPLSERGKRFSLL